MENRDGTYPVLGLRRPEPRTTAGRNNFLSVIVFQHFWVVRVEKYIGELRF